MPGQVGGRIRVEKTDRKVSIKSSAFFQEV